MLLGIVFLLLGLFFPAAIAYAAGVLNESKQAEEKLLANGLTIALRYFGAAILVSNVFLYLFCRKHRTKRYLLLFILSILVNILIVSYITTYQIS